MPKSIQGEKKRGPVEVVESKGVRVPVYLDPAFGKASYTIAYYADGRRVRERAPTLEDARRQAKAKIAELTSGAAHVGSLTPRQTAVVSDAVAVIKDIGVTLSQAVREYAEAYKILKGQGSVVDAARLFVKHLGENSLPAISFQDLAAKFLERNRIQDYSEEYRTDCRKHLAILTRALGTVMVGNLKQPDLAAALLAATNKGSARRYNNLRGTVNAMFSYAQREGYLPRDKKHEASLVEPLNDRSVGRIEIYTPAELEVVLKHIDGAFVPWIVLSGLGGLRTSEVHRITWEMIRFDAKCIVLEKSFTKTKRRRVIPMGDALLAWLKPHVGKGRLYEGTLAAFESRMHAAWPAIADSHGKILVPKRRNGLRHSYGTYRFALLQDENKVSAEMGNSPSELREHYAEIALPGDAEKWFKVTPGKVKRRARRS